MASPLDHVQTIVLLMFENRSFDHLLGHLSLDNPASLIDGYRDPTTRYTNVYNGDAYHPFPIEKDISLSFDLPHEYNYVDTQLQIGPNGTFSMQGFVEAYARATGVSPNLQCDPMGYFTAGQVPITSFLASTYCSCNRWFAPLPTSTQPNRTMAFTGESSIFETKLQLISARNHLFQWLDAAGVRWRVYHDGLSFFVLYPDLWQYVLGPKFRDYESLFADWTTEGDDTRPEVIVVEPTYQDAPHIGSDRPNDNHAPLAIGWGEDFLRRTYQAITANPLRWKNTVLIVYYDEHGGFYDHVPPPFVPFETTATNPFSFTSLGPRIPAVIASPLVKPGSVSDVLLDHTSVLQLLAEKFTPGRPYSASVEQRRQHGIRSVSEILTNEAPWEAPPAPAQPITVTSALGKTLTTEPDSNMGKAFEQSARNMLAREPEQTKVKYPELLQWKAAVEQGRKTNK
jgi:phospholipase C